MTMRPGTRPPPSCRTSFAVILASTITSTSRTSAPSRISATAWSGWRHRIFRSFRTTLSCCRAFTKRHCTPCRTIRSPCSPPRRCCTWTLGAACSRSRERAGGQGCIGPVGPLDEQTGNASDLDFELRAAGLCPIVLCTEPGAVFLTHAEGASFGPRLGDTIPTWLRMIGKISSDERIPKPVRTQVTGDLAHRLDQRLFTIAVGAARRGNREEASRAATLLRERPSGQGASRVASAIVALCASLPPARALLGLLVAFRQWRQRTRWRATQIMFDREFGALVSGPQVSS